MAFPESKLKMLKTITVIALVAFASPSLGKISSAKPQMG
jgi:hypothetical protein